MSRLGEAIVGGIVIGLGVLFFFVGLMAISAILNGFVLVKLWSWFIVPTFGLPALSIPLAIGIALTAKFITQDLSTINNAKKEGSGWTPIVITFINPFLVLLVGWIVKCFVS